VNPVRALAVLLLGYAAATAQPRPLLIDTDAGSDDIMAVALLLAHSDFAVDAITVVNGTAHVDPGARNIGRLLDVAGRQNIPVFAGRDHPLRGNHEFPPEWRKVADGFPILGVFPSRVAQHKPAADYLVEHLRNVREPVGILALGPLTNIAEALQRDRSIARKIREMVIMGGAVHVPGNLQDGGVFHTKNSTAEWNIFIDPLAAKIVFRSGVPIRLIGLDATNRVKIDSEFLLQFAEKHHSRLGAVVWGVLQADQGSIDQGILYAWDPLAAAALLQPEIIKTEPMHIHVTDEGQTVASPGPPNANVAIDADAAAFRALFLKSFAP